MLKRVVITGLGGLCGLGTDVPAIWGEMRAGRSAIGPIENHSLHDLKVRTGCEVKVLPDHGIERKQLVSMDRFSLLAVIAAREAMQQSGLAAHADNTYRMGTIVGVGVCGFETVEENYRAILVEGKNRAGIFTVPRVMPGAAAGQVSMHLGLRGPVFGVTSACSSANHAIASAVDQIRLGRADVMVAGGTESPISRLSLAGFAACRAVARHLAGHSRPTARAWCSAKAPAWLVLESYDHAMARGATILAEIAGAGLVGRCRAISTPSTIEGPEAAMRFCLADAGLNPEDIDYLNAHGTGTKANDQIETTAIKRVFGEHARALSISSTKSMHAHCLGASGGLEMIACVMAIREGVVPPTANYREPDPDCDLDVTPNVARERKVRAAISNGFAFGGTNAVLAFKAI